MVKKLLISYIIILLFAGCNEDPVIDANVSIEMDEISENAETICTIGTEDTILIGLPEEVLDVNIVWESNRDLLQGFVKDIIAQDEFIYVFGTQMDVGPVPEAYEQYLSGDGESIHKYLPAPLYYRDNNAFINYYQNNGEQINIEIINSSQQDYIAQIDSVGEQVFVKIESTNQHEQRIINTIISINNLMLEYIVDSSRKFGFLLLLDGKIYEYFSDYDTGEKYSAVYEILNNCLTLKSYFWAPLVDFGKIIGSTLLGMNIFLDGFEIDIEGTTFTETKMVFENSLFDSPHLFDADINSERNYFLSYLGRESEHVGFFWGAYDRGTDPLFYYLLSDSVELTNLYVVDNGFFITGQEDGKMLLIFLNHDGEIQWKAHFREGILRGIAEYNSRYFIAGDYNIRVTDDPLDWGSDYLYLAEIDLELMDN